jgi:hypothetical protein
MATRTVGHKLRNVRGSRAAIEHKLCNIRGPAWRSSEFKQWGGLPTVTIVTGYNRRRAFAAVARNIFLIATVENKVISDVLSPREIYH